MGFGIGNWFVNLGITNLLLLLLLQYYLLPKCLSDLCKSCGSGREHVLGFEAEWLELAEQVVRFLIVGLKPQQKWGKGSSADAAAGFAVLACQ